MTLISHSLDAEKRTLRIEIGNDLLSTTFDKIVAGIDRVLASDEVKAASWSLLLLDLTKAKLIDSMGLNIIVSLIKKAQAHPARIAARISSPTIHRTFLFTRLEKYMEIELASDPEADAGAGA